MYRVRQKSGVSSLLAMLAAAAPLAAWGTDAGELAATAERFAREAQAGSRFPVHAKAAISDSRIQMPVCSSPVSAQLPAGSHWAARTLVQLRCEGNPRWSILIPIDIESEVPVLVLRSAARRGSTPASEDLLAESRRVPGTSADYVNSPSALLRQHLRRDLGAGSVLTAADLEPDTLVRRGQTVSVLAEAEGLSLRTEAVAMADARAGERVRLQNRNSLKVFEGLVDKEGTVRVSP